MKIVTIGVYGYTEDAFFEALQAARVDTFCDIRQRRGVRGAAYAFANSQRLQQRLAALGIRYLYLRDLAPTTAVRQQQQAADKSSKTAKRQRAGLSPAFIAAYQEAVLDRFDFSSLRNDLPGNARVMALFCVEREAIACHRSLAADKLAEIWFAEVQHLEPAP